MKTNADATSPGMQGDIIPGRRAVLEALRADRPIRKLLIAKGTTRGGIVRVILDEARRRHVTVQYVTPARLDALMPRATHQGAIALASARPPVALDAILEHARARGEPPLVVVLDGLQNPANLGAILRTADGAGVHGVVIPRHRAVGLTGAVAKTSAGAIEHVPVAEVTNLVRALEALKAAGLWVAGADPGAADLYYETRLVPPLALVIGGEERGLSRLVREHCDFLVRLPMRGHLASLNVAVATGVLLYEVLRQSTGSSGSRPHDSEAGTDQTR
ncbi:MAG: 23S rRNA (guanosine(2251)-2'-O)-methyltransferase RlmB [bacterium]